MPAYANQALHVELGSAAAGTQNRAQQGRCEMQRSALSQTARAVRQQRTCTVPSSKMGRPRLRRSSSWSCCVKSGASLSFSTSSSPRLCTPCSGSAAAVVGTLQALLAYAR